MGFASIQQWVDSVDAGRVHMTTFRKAVSSAATVANTFVDYTYFSGNPPANFYASSPLVAATIERALGINVPLLDNQFIKSVTVMNGASSATVTTSQNQRLLLADYLLYYPFIESDAVGEEQVFTNDVTLPRYESGEGVQVMAVAQGTSSTVGQFTINYTNSDGVAGRVSQVTSSLTTNGGGVLVNSTAGAQTGAQNFIQLRAGDKGVRSIESCTFTAAGGGILALVLVKPLWHFYSTQECRRTTSGNLESYGAATQFESIIHRPTVEVKNGAVLGIIGLGNNGSLASSTLSGTLETVWSN